MPWLRRRPKTLTVVEAYARWAKTYPSEAHNPLMELEQRATLELLPDVSGCAALDLGCGSGRYLRRLLVHGAACAVGVDLSRAMLARARSAIASANLVQSDMLALPLPAAAFDRVVCGLAVGHVPDLKPALAEIARVLRPNGVVVYSDFHPFGAYVGWARSFQAADGRTFAVEHHPHLYADHHAASQAAGLVIEAVREPVIDFDHKWRGCPAALIIRARKA